MILSADFATDLDKIVQSDSKFTGRSEKSLLSAHHSNANIHSYYCYYYVLVPLKCSRNVFSANASVFHWTKHR